MSLETKLVLACSEAHRTRVITLLEEGANPNSDDATDRWSGATPSHYACQHGWFDVVTLLIESHQCKPDVRDSTGRTPLHYACRYEHTHAIIVFLVMICNPNVTDKSGDTPLHKACQSGSLASTKCLLEPRLEKCDPNCKNNSGLTPLQVIKRDTRSSPNYVDIICELIQRGAHCSSLDLSVFDNHGNTALHNACQQGNLISARCLLQAKKCDPNCKSECGLTPLLVTPARHSSIVSELLQHGANPNSVDSDGNTALHKACRAQALNSVKCLLAIAKCDPNCRNKLGMTPLHVSTLENADTIVNELIQHGAKLNIASGSGNTPLHIACELGMLKAAQYLSRAPSCDPNIKNKKGLTPIQLTPHAFFMTDTPALIKELVQQGVNPNIVDSDGNTPLHLACRAGDENIIKCLVETEKCDLNHKNKTGRTPLHMTILQNADILNEFIRHGANPNIPNNDGNTPLHDACRLGSLIAVQCLLQAPNCDPNIKNQEGLTALQVTPPECINVIKELVLHGANPNAVDSDGTTPLHRACHAGELESVKFLLKTAKCDPNHVNVNGRTPFHMTSVKDSDILQELIRHGGNPVIVDKDGNTLLHIACMVGRLITVQHLLPFVKCESKNKAGLTPLQVTSPSCTEIINQLIHNGANAIVADRDGNTPLHNTCSQGNLASVKCLLNNTKCDLNYKNKAGLTPLQVTSPKCTEIIGELVQHGADPNVVDSDGNTLLHNVCSNGKLSHVKCLLNIAKYDLNCKNKAGLTPLQVTSPQFAYIVKELIERGADPNVVDSDGNTPLHCSCSQGNLMSVTYLLNGTTYLCDTNCKNNAGLTPLKVTPSNCYDLASKLIKYIANYDVNIDGGTALHIACREGMVDVVKNNMEQFSQDLNSKNKAGLTPIQVVPPIFASIIWELIEQGANPNVVNIVDGDTPLHKACFEEKLQYVEYLLKIAKCDPDIKNRAGLTPLQVTASWNTSIIVALIAHGANPNVVDRYGDTPLHKACRDESVDTVKSLLGIVNCDPNVKNNVGKTPIQLTMLWNKNIIKELLQHGANPNAADNYGNTQLHNACHAGRLDSVKCFLSVLNCDPNIKNSAGLTPLQVTSPEHFKIIRKLVQHGANPKVIDNEGNTLLHCACSHGKLNCVQVLLETAKCDPNIRNSAGLTPLRVTDTKCIGIIQALIEHSANPNVADSDGNTLLHNACCDGRVETVKYLLEEAKCNPATKNKAGLTPLQITPPDFIDIIRELVKHGANPQDVYKSLGRYLKSPLQCPIKVFVVGDSGVGKSTLTAALQKESTFFARTFMPARKVTDVDQKTAGVIPYEFESKEYGYATIYDFAGQREFYGSHAALMENAIQHSPPIILLVVDLSKSEEKINQTILYWFTFLENQCTSVSSEPHIMIVGSHADVLKINGEDLEAKTRAIKSRIPHSSFVFVRFITMDCQYSDSPGISELRQCLKTSCNALRTNVTINFNSHCFYVYLLDTFKGIAAVTVKEIQHRTKITQATSSLHPDSVMSFIPSSLHALYQICKELNDRGHMLFLKDSENIENSWVVIDKVALLSQVTGTMFAPEGFKQHSILTQCKCSTGVVPLSNIATQFPNHNPTMLVGFLSCLEICHEISDEEILLLITSEHQTCMLNRPLAGSHDRYFLFPALVSLNVPRTVWEPNESQFAYHSGWMLQCSNDSSKQFFTSRFLQVLLLRLAFCFPLSPNEQGTIPAFHKICSIWKNGLFWGNKHGVETLVEVISDNKVVVLLMRCDKSSLIELLKLRSQVIQKITRATNEFCSRVHTIESFIDPSKIEQYPLKPISQLKLFSLRNVCYAAIDVKPSSVLCTTGTIPFEKLILFEPYAGLGVSTLNQLFNDQYQAQNLNGIVSDSFLMSVAQKCTSEPELIPKMFIPTCELHDVSNVREILSMLKHWRDSSKGTYQKLREVLDQFSIFSGRNPLVRTCDCGFTLMSIVCKEC